MYRFLIVDDNRDDALQLSFLIGTEFSKETECEFASTRKDALDWLDPRRHKPVDACLLDLNLPDSQGAETYRAVRAAAPNMPILIWSGRNDDRDLRDLLIDEGAAGYLDKGHVDSRMVFEALRDAARRARTCARLGADDTALLAEAERRGTECVEATANSLPPQKAQAAATLALIRQTAVMTKQGVKTADEVGYLRRAVERLEERDREHDGRLDDAARRIADAEATGRHTVVEVEKTKKLSAANKVLLKRIAIALAAILYALNEGDKAVKLIGALLGFGP